VEVVQKKFLVPTEVKGVYHFFNLDEKITHSEQWKIKRDILTPLAHSGAKAILVDFFAYSCTNCIRCIPPLRRLREVYEPDGLRIVAFHRPEFEFERNPFNMRDFLRREGIKYIVGLDNEDAAWNDWKVEFWPQHFLVVPSEDKTEFTLVYTHYGDRNHHELEQAVVIELFKNQHKPEIHAYNHESWLDAEIFMGKSHRGKNNSNQPGHGGGGCGEGACRIQKRVAGAGQEVPLPQQEGVTVFGTEWCPFCRRSKLLLTEEQIPFIHIDLDSHGGPSNAAEFFAKKGTIPETHKTIPIIFRDGKFIGGFTDLVNILKSEGKATEDVLQTVTAKSGANHVDFQKGNTHANVTLDASAWTTTPEYILSKVDSAPLGLSWNMTSLTDYDVWLYLVAEPPNNEGLVTQRSKELSTVGGASGNIAVYGEKAVVVEEQVIGIEENRFEKKRVVVERENREIMIPYPDRHLVGKLRLEPSEDGSGSAEVNLRFDKDIKLYVIYLTTEPGK